MAAAYFLAISTSLRILLNFSKMSQVFSTVSLSRERSVFGGLGFNPSVCCGQVRQAASPFLLISASLAWSRSKSNLLLLLQLHVFKQQRCICPCSLSTGFVSRRPSVKCYGTQYPLLSPGGGNIKQASQGRPAKSGCPDLEESTKADHVVTK